MGYGLWSQKETDTTEATEHALLYIELINNKNLLYSTGNSTQYSVMTYVGNESKKRVDMCVCITDSLGSILKLIQHCKSTILQ